MAITALHFALIALVFCLAALTVLGGVRYRRKNVRAEIERRKSISGSKPGDPFDNWTENIDHRSHESSSKVRAHKAHEA